MNQQKIGEFLKQLRKDKGLTQEQLAERFSVSSRTVSRWETGSNMPDVETLIELADFYNVDIREIIDGERKSENTDEEIKNTIKKVADYAAEESNKRNSTKLEICLCLFLIGYIFIGWYPITKPLFSEKNYLEYFGLIVLLSLQLLLCFIGRKLIIRLIPGLLCFTVCAIHTVLYVYNGSNWESLKYFVVAYPFGCFLATCCAAWIIWGATKLVKLYINKRKRRLQNENVQ